MHTFPGQPAVIDMQNYSQWPCSMSPIPQTGLWEIFYISRHPKSWTPLQYYGIRRPSMDPKTTDDDSSQVSMMLWPQETM